MTTLRQAAQQALEALDKADKISGHPNNKVVRGALRAALAEQPAEQEPVAHLYRDHNGELRLNCMKPEPYFAFPVYTAPQPKAEPLTDIEIYRMWTDGWDSPQALAFARAIERAHGIGEGA